MQNNYYNLTNIFLFTKSTHLVEAFDGLLVQEIIADDDEAVRAGESDHALERNARRMAREQKLMRFQHFYIS